MRFAPVLCVLSVGRGLVTVFTWLESQLDWMMDIVTINVQSVDLQLKLWIALARHNFRWVEMRQYYAFSASTCTMRLGPVCVSRQ